jgi:tRNA threonylcarbamoyladenosine biosynthesis protein TsaE
MGQSELTGLFGCEDELSEEAGEAARRWSRAGLRNLVIGLRGDLGAGKTTWVRGMLRGLGYTGRVPSPTYTLLEQYPVDSLTVVHLDLYRLKAAEELETLGVRDWLGTPDVWLLIEWPERSLALSRHCDVSIELHITGPASRRATWTARSSAGAAALGEVSSLPEFHSS